MLRIPLMWELDHIPLFVVFSTGLCYNNKGQSGHITTYFLPVSMPGLNKSSISHKYRENKQYSTAGAFNMLPRTCWFESNILQHGNQGILESFPLLSVALPVFHAEGAENFEVFWPV